jgi:hypothetical protein
MWKMIFCSLSSSPHDIQAPSKEDFEVLTSVFLLILSYKHFELYKELFDWV